MKFTDARQLFPVSMAIKDFHEAYGLNPDTAMREQAYALAQKYKKAYDKGELTVGDCLKLVRESNTGPGLGTKVVNNMRIACDTAVEASRFAHEKGAVQ